MASQTCWNTHAHSLQYKTFTASAAETPTHEKNFELLPLFDAWCGQTHPVDLELRGRQRQARFSARRRGEEEEEKASHTNRFHVLVIIGCACVRLYVCVCCVHAVAM